MLLLLNALGETIGNVAQAVVEIGYKPTIDNAFVAQSLVEIGQRSTVDNVLVAQVIIEVGYKYGRIWGPTVQWF